MPTLSDSQIAAVLRTAGFPADQIGIGVAIAKAESGGRTDALNTKNRNGSWDAGLMQVNSIHGYSQRQLFDPTFNASASLKIFRAAGSKWTPWSTYNNGAYRTHLAQGNIAAGGGGANVPPPSSSGSVASPVNLLPDVGGLFATILDPKTWIRIGLMMFGGLLILAAAWQMTGAGGMVIKTAKGIVSARTGGIL